MSSKNLGAVLEAAANGDEKAYRIFFKETWEVIESPLTKLTRSGATSKSIYLNSMITFWEVFVIDKKPLPKNIEGYIFSICRNSWYAQKKQAQKEGKQDSNISLENLMQSEEVNEETAIEEETYEFQRQKALTIALDEASEKCKCLFEHHIDQGTSLKELVEPLGYPSYQAIVQAKYNCKKRMVARVYQLMKYADNMPVNKKRFIG